MPKLYKIFLVLFPLFSLAADVSLGVDAFLTKENIKKYKGKRIGIITNQTAITKDGKLVVDSLLEEPLLNVTTIFAPEHGFYGYHAAGNKFGNEKYKNKTPIISLHGKTRRPTKEMLKNIDVLVFDIQDIGIRSYTYTSTLFYCMEEAAKAKIDLLVFDRPNPMGGDSFDGPMLEKEFRSFIGYINVPYCHGMTAAELALLFNKEYKIGCKLTVYKMKGWERSMTFKDTNLLWVPTSPNIPESDSPFYCATTGILGELSLVSIGIGTSFPFKVVGAPWINAPKFAEILNKQDLPGVKFTPFYFASKKKNQICHGVKIHITDTKRFKPIRTGNMILGLLKSLYPREISKKLGLLKGTNISLFNKAIGSDKYLSILTNETFPAYKLIETAEKDHSAFEPTRKKYLLYK